MYWQLRDAGLAQKRPDHSKYLPWKVKTEHAHARPAMMLRLLSRRDQGDAVPDVKERMLDKWLGEVKAANVVVCYHRDMAPNPANPTTGGFYYSKRRPTDGESLVRDTSDDDTSNLPKIVDPSGSR
ncbi:hypothetical protein [Streptomyces sp. NPDC048637]|uniref:hypothetical protein n=1 Tax=Streptomyces sp. NPDC048637 TaxID=3155636 RepID=UPI0034242D7B